MLFDVSLLKCYNEAICNNANYLAPTKPMYKEKIRLCNLPDFFAKLLWIEIDLLGHALRTGGSKVVKILFLDPLELYLMIFNI